jgi:hypothetical protein
MGSYILSKTRYDYAFIILPGLISILLLSLFADFEIPLEILAIFAFYFSDAGHVYTTIWRYDHKMKHSRLELLFPLIGFFLLFFLWAKSELPYLWSLVIYATYLHNLRQIYGISRWYQKVNHKFDAKIGNWLFYLLNVTPFVVFHFRSDFVADHNYPFSSIFFYTDAFLYQVGLVVYIFAWIAWLAYQFKQGNMKSSCLPVFLFPLCLSLTYAYSFLIATDLYEIMIPLVISHGIAYMALIEKSHRVLSGPSIILPIVLTAFFGGFFDFFAHDGIEEIIGPGDIKVVAISLALAFLFTHYYIDTYIWKSTNSDAKKIYS